MKILLFLLLLLCASRLAAQSPAGDPNAIDFTPKMDTVGGVEGTILNMGVLNTDAFEDFSFLQYPRSTIRFGGPLLFDTTEYPFLHPEEGPELLGDFTGTGRIDLIGNWGSSTPVYHKRLPSLPYFDSLGSTIFTVHGDQPRIGLFIGTEDCDRDGIVDAVFGGGTDHWAGFLIYHGSKQVVDSAYKYPDDSLPIPPGLREATIGTFSKGGRPMLLVACSNTNPTTHVTTLSIGALRHLNDLAHDSVVYLSHTSKIASAVLDNDDSMISAQGMYVTDITGDGIDDLLVTDDHRIYIFKGSDSLGYYPLTKDRAYYSIPNPRLLDWQTNKFINVDLFGRYMRACGDLTGSGIPYLMVIGEPDVSNISIESNALFYAGGKALDTLYDAVATFQNDLGITIDTLHTIKSGGHTAVLMEDGEDRQGGHGNSFNLLLYNDADKIPHTTNPKFAVASRLGNVVDNLSIVSGNGYVKLHAERSMPERATVAVYNILGQELFGTEDLLAAGDNITYIDTKSWPSGMYIATVTGERGSTTTKFTIIRN